MYRVLLVDDEPIILSGIKYLIDWEKNNCKVVDTARNGRQALEKILALDPDIVICDLNMPVISGTELLEQVSKEKPDIVFIVLTNHQEFDLAQKSLRYHAVDYLVKSQLEAPTLEKSLALACKERSKRSKIARVELVDDYLSANKKKLIDDAFVRIVSSPPGRPMEDAITVLKENGILQNYSLIYLQMNFPAMPNYAQFTEEELKHLYAWECDIIKEIAQNFFQNFTFVIPDQQCERLMLACWKIQIPEYAEKLNLFYSKLLNASTNITQVHPCMLATDPFEDAAQIHCCREQLFKLRDYFYFAGSEKLLFKQVPDVDYKPLRLSGIATKLSMELKSKNLMGCLALLDKAIKQVTNIPHNKSQATWLCSELYSAVCNTVASVMPEVIKKHTFFDNVRGYLEIDKFYTRRQVLRWLQQFKNELSNVLDKSSKGQFEIVEKVKQYVQDNIYERIMLQDVAEHVCISPGYLSSVFKKLYNQNLVDYINEAKMDRACKIIQEDKYRIGEIAYMLNFENAYYFTRVFKRYIGMTPTEYQQKMKASSQAHT